MKTAPKTLLLGVCVLLLSGPTVSAVSLDVRPNLQQFFPLDSVSLSCVDDQQTGGQTGGQTVKRTTRGQTGGQTGGQVDQCGSGGFGVFNGSSCTISGLSQSDSGVYWCETSSGQKSLQVDINVTTGQLILKIPALPVMTGSDVTLSCSVKSGNSETKTDKAYFFRSGNRTGSIPELRLSRVQQSDEGLYWCSTDVLESPKSWLRVRDPPTSPPTSPPPPPPSSPPPLPPPPPPPPLSLVRLFVHLLVFCPFFVSTGLMLSIYCSTDIRDKAAVSMEMDLSVGGAHGLDEAYDDVTADVTTVHEL